MEDDASSQDKHQFNMAIALLQRIDRILNYIVLARKKKDFREWYDLLEILCQEISHLFKKEEIDKDNTYQEVLIPLCQTFDNVMFYDEPSEKYCLSPGRQFEDYYKLAGLLKEYDKFLRHCMEVRDMGSPKKRDAKLAIIDT